MQKLIVIGNVGGDPEMKESKGGLEICKFSIAVNHKRGDNEHTEWFNATAFGKLAVNVNRFVKKGNKIYAEGRLQTRKFEGDDGEMKYFTDFLVNEVEFLTPKAEGQPTPKRYDDVPY